MATGWLLLLLLLMMVTPPPPAYETDILSMLTTLTAT